MALPGVTSVIRDQSQTLSRTDIPDDVKRVGIIGRRSNAAGDPLTAGSGVAAPDYDPFVAVSEEVVKDHFGSGSELHRGYLEATSGGAGRVVLIPMTSTVTDSDLATDTSDGNPFDAAFDAVEAAQIDIVVPWGRGSHPLEWQSPATPGDDPTEFGFYADATGGLLKRVADKCRQITDRSYPLFAVMGVKPYVAGAQSMTVAEVQSHSALSNLPDRETIGENGAFVSVVATELVPTGYDAGTYGYANGAATYAGYVSSLSQEIAPTAQPLFNVAGLRYTLTRPQQISVVDKGVVPIATDFSRRAVVVDGLTFAKPTSDYTRLTTLRVVFGAVQLVRRACRSFIGKPATLHHRNSMETAIYNRLRALQIGGVLLNSDFTVEYRPAENKAIVNLVLQPAFEMRNIDISVSVQL